MPKMSHEREGFRLRLHQALLSSHYSTERPTELARDFNSRFGGKPVTVHAARKWLVGESIPTQDKMRALAEWLGVSAEWLRFGVEDYAANVESAAYRDEQEKAKLVADLSRLCHDDQELVREIMRILLRHSSVPIPDEK